jgi:hypothetical protein
LYAEIWDERPFGYMKHASSSHPGSYAAINLGAIGGFDPSRPTGSRGIHGAVRPYYVATHPRPRRTANTDSRHFRGTTVITRNTALRLARYFNISPEFGLNMQRDYDLEVESEAVGDRLEREVKRLSWGKQSSAWCGGLLRRFAARNDVAVATVSLLGINPSRGPWR